MSGQIDNHKTHCDRILRQRRDRGEQANPVERGNPINVSMLETKCFMDKIILEHFVSCAASVLKQSGIIVLG